MYRGNVKIAGSANIVKESVITGDVEIGEDSCVLFYTVIRGDEAPIRIGKRSNIQENSTLHVDAGHPCVIGDDVTVGHNAVIHGCTIGDACLIGMGSVVMNGAKIGRECLIGAGSLVLQGTEIPDGSLVMGSPAKVKRPLSDAERESIYHASSEYQKIGKALREEGFTI